MRRLHALACVVPAAPRLTTHGAGDAVLRRLVRADPAAADRLHPAGRPLADAGLPRAAARLDAGADHAPRPSRRARRRCSVAAREAASTPRSAAAATGGDPFAPARRAEARKATLTHQADAARRRGRASRRSRAQIRAALATLPGARSQGRPRRLGREVHAGAARRRPGGADRRAARAVERDLRTHPGHRQRHLDREPDAARDRRAARLRARRRPGRDQPRRSPRPLRVATAGDYDQRLPKLNLAQRQVPIVVKLPDAARARTSALLERLAVPGTRGPVMLGQVADARRSRAARPQIDRYDR